MNKHVYIVAKGLNNIMASLQELQSWKLDLEKELNAYQQMEQAEMEHIADLQSDPEMYPYIDWAKETLSDIRQTIIKLKGDVEHVNNLQKNL